MGYILGLYGDNGKENGNYYNGLYKYIYIWSIWVVFKIMVPFWIPILIRHLIFRVAKKGPEF